MGERSGFNGFRSLIASSVFDARDQWVAQEIVFHSPSEHTIDGKRFDLEMQIVHTFVKTEEEIRNEAAQAFASGGRRLAEEEKNTEYAIASILFSVDDFNQTVTDDLSVDLEQFFS